MNPASAIDAVVRGGLAKRVLRRYFREDSCINSVRVLLEVFRGLGVAASPFSVRAMVFSPAFVARAVLDGGIPHSDAELRAWTADPAVYSVGIGFGTVDLPPRTWPGHLVLRIGGGLIDPTVDQADRPAHGIRLPEMLVLRKVPDEFWAGRGVVVEVASSGCVLRYEPRPASNGYLGSPAWRLRPGIEEAACLEILAGLKERKCG